MKRFTLILSLLVAMVTTTMAQGGDVRLTADDLNAKTKKTAILIRCTQVDNSNTYYNPNGRGALGENSIVYWVPAGNGEFYITKGDGENDYLQTGSTKTFGTQATAAKFHAVKPTSSGSLVSKFDGANCYENEATGGEYWVRLAFTDNSKWFNFNGDTYNTGTGVWTVQNIYEVVTITYNIKYNDETKLTVKTAGIVGNDFPEIPASSLPFGVIVTKPEGKVSAEGTFDLEATVSLPFEYADSYEKINNWYYLQFHANSKNYLYYGGTADVLDASKTAVDLTQKDNYTWGFIGDPFTGFTVVNYGAGEGKALNAAKGGAIVGDEAQVMTLTASSHGENGFFMQNLSGDYKERFNKQNDQVVYWSGADAGSTFMVSERPMGPVAELDALLVEANALKTTVEGNQGTIIGKYSAETLTALAAAIDDASAIEEANVTEEDVATLQAAINAVSVILPTAGRYYQFHSSLTAFAETKAVHGTDGNPGWKTLNNDDKNFYWKAVETGNGIALQNAANGKYLHGNAGQSGAWSLTDSPEGAEINVKIFSEAEHVKGFEYGIILNNWQMHANNHGGGANASGNLVSWNTDNANSASSWYIVEVELEEFFTVTYNFKYNDEIKYTHSVELAKGAAFPTVNVALPYGVTTDFAVPEGTVETDATFNFNLTVEAELPFETAASANAITKWYYVRMHTNQPGYIGDVADNNTVNVAWGKASDSYNDNYVWGFVGDVFSGVKVVNKAGMQMTSTGNGDVTLSDNGTPFFVARTTETSANATNGFCLRKFDSNNYLNANYSAGKLSHWASTDAGSTFFLSEYEEDVVTVSEAGWATMYLGYQAYIPEDVNVYAVTGVENGWVTKSQLEGVIPANTGVLLENAGEFTFKRAAKDVNALEGNLMKGSVEDTYVEGTAYVLANHAETGVGMYKAELNKDAEGNDGTTHFKNNAGKAYLVLPAEQSTVAFYGFDWDGTTGIDEITDNREQSTVIYDLTGRRVEAITAPGIYVVNGKKVLVK